MYDKYLIVGEEFKNVVEDGKVVGFQYGARLPYYRGVVLSLVGALKLTVDGVTYPAHQMSVTLHGNTYPLTELENITTDKWEFGEIGIIKVNKPGGLEPGKHEVSISQEMKISYVPGGFWGSDAKVLTMNQ